MSDRDVQRDMTPTQFAETLRRIADAIDGLRLMAYRAALDGGDRVRIQVAGKRFRVPADAKLSIEHEAEGGEHELELQLAWSDVNDAHGV